MTREHVSMTLARRTGQARPARVPAERRARVREREREDRAKGTRAQPAASARLHSVRLNVTRVPMLGQTPTPRSREYGPEEAAVEEDLPFDRLQAKYPLAPSKNAFGTGKGRLGDGVRLLRKSKVGSFTAFVLAASDDAALAKWLKDHELVSTPKADRWLTHYVRMKFYFVALRYDPPKETPATDEVVAETIRISFKTPVPYYPYYEPEPETGQVQEERVLQLWLLTKTPAMPVSLLTDGKTHRWVQPLHGGKTYWLKREQIHKDLGPILKGSLPEGNILLQTFQDQKSSRKGFGDIVFIPAKRRVLSSEQNAARAPLLGILDPSFVPKNSAP